MTFVTGLFVYHGGMNTTLADYLRAFRASDFKRCVSDFTLVKRSLVYRSLSVPRQLKLQNKGKGYFVANVLVQLGSFRHLQRKLFTVLRKE